MVGRVASSLIRIGLLLLAVSAAVLAVPGLRMGLVFSIPLGVVLIVGGVLVRVSSWGAASALAGAARLGARALGAPEADRPRIVCARRRSVPRWIPPPRILVQRGVLLLLLLPLLALEYEAGPLGHAVRVAAVFATGVLLVGHAMVLERRRRAVAETPTSRARSLAHGRVEVSGLASALQPLCAPLTGAPCVWWRYTIETRKVLRGVDGWAVLEDVDSSVWPFQLEDATGRLTIDAGGAQVDLPHRHRADPLLDEGARALLAARAADPHSELGAHRGQGFRITEWHVPEGAPLHVLGLAQQHAMLARERLRRGLPFDLRGPAAKAPAATLSERTDPIARYRERIAPARRDALRLVPGRESEELPDAAGRIGETVVAVDPLQPGTLFLAATSERDLLERLAARSSLLAAAGGTVFVGLAMHSWGLARASTAGAVLIALAGLMLLWARTDQRLRAWAEL